jgi:hypothetical protein
MNDALKNALPFAEAGWKLFPAFWNNGKHIGAIKWKDGSSSDPAVITQWAERYPATYFCVNLKASGLVVLDVDNKKGKEGGKILQTLLTAHHSKIETLQSSTPSGGQHYFFKGSCAFTTDKLGFGLDTPVMVPLPGSVVPRKGTYTLVRRGVPANLPAWIAEAAGKPSEKKEKYDIPLTDFDQQRNIDRAISWLINEAPLSTEGSAGDHTAYTVAAKMRDFAVSESTAVDILLEHWYPHCNPNNKPEFIEAKVKNAYNYSNDRAGNATPEALFIENKSTTNIRCAADVSINSLKPRAWILGTRYLKGYTTLTVAPGGSGKSMLLILEGLSIASGKKLTHGVVKTKGAVWLYNTEDPFDELDRRVLAAAKHHKLTRKDLSQFYYSSAYENPMTLVAYNEKNQPVKNDDLIESIIKDIIARGIVLFIVDPFVECHTAGENDNGAINMVMRVFRYIAYKTGCAVSIVHHVSKGTTDVHGNVDKARGASAMASAARIAHTFYTMSHKECKSYAVLVEQADWYARLDSAKANLSPPGGPTDWYEKKSVSLWYTNDETVGTLQPTKLDMITAEREDDFIAVTAMNLIDDNGAMVLRQVAAELIDLDITKKKLSGIMSCLERAFALPLRGGDNCTYQITKRLNDKNRMVKHLTREKVN